MTISLKSSSLVGPKSFQLPRVNIVHFSLQNQDFSYPFPLHTLQTADHQKTSVIKSSTT